MEERPLSRGISEGRGYMKPSKEAVDAAINIFLKCKDGFIGFRDGLTTAYAIDVYPLEKRIAELEHWLKSYQERVADVNVTFRYRIAKLEEEKKEIILLFDRLTTPQDCGWKSKNKGGNAT
jgi:hypothetical protein